MEKWFALASAIAAFISIFYSRKANKTQRNLVLNEDDINRAKQAINNIREAQALPENNDLFEDDEFMSIWENNLKKAKISIAVLRRNPTLREALKDINVNSFHDEQFDGVVASLEICKGLLLK